MRQIIAANKSLLNEIKHNRKKFRRANAKKNFQREGMDGWMMGPSPKQTREDTAEIYEINGQWNLGLGFNFNSHNHSCRA